MLFSSWAELCDGLRWHDVVMAGKVDDAVSLPITGQEVYGGIVRINVRFTGITGSFASGQDIVTLAVETAFAKTCFKQIGTGPIFSSRRIFRGDSDQLL